MDTSKEAEPKPKRILQALLLPTYKDPSTGNKVDHPLARWKGEGDKRKLDGGSKWIGAGGQVGPPLELKHGVWVDVDGPEARVARLLARLKTEFSHMVQLRFRPEITMSEDLTSDIPVVSEAESLTTSKNPADWSPKTGRKGNR